MRGKDGKGIKNVRIGLYAELGGRSRPLVSKTDDAGRYRFASVSVGAYRLTVAAGDSLREFIDNVQVDGNRRIEFELIASAANKDRLLVWVPASTGTQLSGRWVDVNRDAVHQEQRVDQMTGEGLRRIQERAGNIRP